MRYCTTRFASRIPTWRLPVPGHIAALITAGSEVPGALGIEAFSRGVLRFTGSGMVKKKNSTKQKNSCAPRWLWDSMSSTGVEEVLSCGVFAVSCS